MRVESVPEPTLRRLPSYYHYLVRLREEGQEMVSAAQMGEDLGLHQTQVRKDLAFTGSQGRPKVGHRVDDLLSAIENFLNWNNTTDAFLVGAGHLGSALLGYTGFERTGVKIIAAFDRSPSLVGSQIKGVTILHMDRFPDLVKRMHIGIGIITVPSECAQKTANIMVQSGIKAIWNFAPAMLDVPDDIVVENVALYSSLAVLSRKLSIQKKHAELAL